MRVSDHLARLVGVLPGFQRHSDETLRHVFQWFPAVIRVVPIHSATVGWRADMIINLAQPESRTEQSANIYLSNVEAWRMKLPPHGVYLDLV